MMHQNSVLRVFDSGSFQRNSFFGHNNFNTKAAKLGKVTIKASSWNNHLHNESGQRLTFQMTNELSMASLFPSRKQFVHHQQCHWLHQQTEQKKHYNHLRWEMPHE